MKSKRATSFALGRPLRWIVAVAATTCMIALPAVAAASPGPPNHGQSDRGANSQVHQRGHDGRGGTGTHGHHTRATSDGGDSDTLAVPAPPSPPKGKLPPRHRAEPATTRAALQTQSVAVGRASHVRTPTSAKTWGEHGDATTLVLYDTTSEYGWLGELYALVTGNLATHFGTVTAEPVKDYQSGQIGEYTATVYLGSTYDEALPDAFLSDALNTTRPLVWVYDNIWQLGSFAGASAFASTYGFDPTQSYFAPDAVATVRYKDTDLTRSSLNGAGILGADIVDPSKVTVLASAECPTACSSLSRSTDGTSFPWAIRSGNLTYVGEIPFAYVNETDRALIFSDLLYDALAPNTATRHQAMVRIEDVSPNDDPASLRAIADYLSSQHVPFSIAVIPVYTDPNGFSNDGHPETITLADRPQVVSAIRYMERNGGTIVQHGTTHQHDELANPYNAVTADDFEFFRSECSTTPTPPYDFFAPCGNQGYVILEGPLPGDSTRWASQRVAYGKYLFGRARLTTPSIFETPHYAASAADYAGIAQNYSVRYERGLYFGGLLQTGTPDYSRIVGQFFPYEVHDIYGTDVLPEDIGNYEAEPYNDHPPTLAADIVERAKKNLVVRDGFASFFYHGYLSVDPLREIVAGIKAEGYTFVSPQQVLNES